MKICLVCSPGGHLTEALALESLFAEHDVFLVTYKEEFLNTTYFNQRPYFIRNYIINHTHKNYILKTFAIIIHMILLTMKELKILIEEKPDVIISTGSEIAIPIFYIAKVFNKKTIYIESVCRVKTLSGTGKILYHITDLFLVQWEGLAERYRKAQFQGNVLYEKMIESSWDNDEKRNLILVTVGTAPFPRLIVKMDEISKDLDESLLMQTGRTNYEPKNTEFFNFTNYDEIQRLTRKARVVISHAGVGCIMTALEQGATLILVPRLKKYGEVNDNHQFEITKILHKQKLVRVAYDVNDLPSILEEIKTIKVRNFIKNDKYKLVSFLGNYLRK